MYSLKDNQPAMYYCGVCMGGGVYIISRACMIILCVQRMLSDPPPPPPISSYIALGLCMPLSMDELYKYMYTMCVHKYMYTMCVHTCMCMYTFLRYSSIMYNWCSPPLVQGWVDILWRGGA